jgi:hypothetical protein
MTDMDLEHWPAQDVSIFRFSPLKHQFQ